MPSAGEEGRAGGGIDRLLLGLAIVIAVEVVLLLVVIFAVFLPNVRKQDAARGDPWADILSDAVPPSGTASSPSSGGPATGGATDAASVAGGGTTEPGGKAGGPKAIRYVPTRMRGYDGVRVRISPKTGTKELTVDPFPEDADDRPSTTRKKERTRK